MLTVVHQGVGGKHIKYDTRSESYVIDPALRLNGTVRDTALCLCELGWLYNKVMECVNRVAAVTPSISSSDGGTAPSARGLVMQAFCFAVQEELHDYYRLLAVLEQEAKRTAADVSVEHSASHRHTRSLHGISQHQQQQGVKAATSDLALMEGSGGTSGLTLLRMKAWMQEPIERCGDILLLVVMLCYWRLNQDVYVGSLGGQRRTTHRRCSGVSAPLPLSPR